MLECVAIVTVKTFRNVIPLMKLFSTNCFRHLIEYLTIPSAFPPRPPNYGECMCLNAMQKTNLNMQWSVALYQIKRKKIFFKRSLGMSSNVVNKQAGRRAF